MAGSADMEKMSRNRRKEKPINLGSMKAARPMDDSDTEADLQEMLERARKARMDMGLTPSRDVEERAMEEAARERADEQMREAYEAAPRRSMGTYAKGGSVSSASKRADGCAQRGKTKGRMV